MNKKLMAAAIAGLLVAPAAFAQSSNVQLYGRANLGIDNYKAKGATAVGDNLDGRMRIYDNSSRVGLRGTEDLGGGLKAIFQIETGVAMDAGGTGNAGASAIGQGGQGNTSAGAWGSRDTWAGLQANWGRVTFGRQSMYWANGVNAQFAANYINTEIPWTNGTNLGRVSVGAAGSAPARVSNTLQYTSPTWAGNNFTLSYSPNAQEAVQTTGASVDTDGVIWAATWRGTFGPIYGQIDYANVQGNTTRVGATSAQPKGSAWKVGGSWGYHPGARIGLIWVKTEVDNATGAVGGGVAAGDQVNSQGWTLNWEHTFGNIQALAQYGQTNGLRGCDAISVAGACDNTKAKGFMVGGRYLLSKRTWLYASYNQISNESNQWVDYTGGGITSNNSGAHLGADPKIWALGFFHHF